MATVRQFQVTFDCAEPSASPASGGGVGYVDRPRRRGSPRGTIRSHAPPSGRVRVRRAGIPPAWARACSSSASPKARSSRTGCIVVRAGTGLVGDERLATLEAECARLAALGAVRERLLLADEENEWCPSTCRTSSRATKFCLDLKRDAISGPPVETRLPHVLGEPRPGRPRPPAAGPLPAGCPRHRAG